MNERFEQMMLEATKDMPQGYYVPGEYFQKFAELIVQECIDIISPYTVRMSRPGEEYLHPIQEIRKNFGVEE